MPAPRLPADLRAALSERRLATADAQDSIRRLAAISLAAAASVAVAVAVDHPAGWMVHATVVGLVLTSCIAAEHEALHGSLFDSRWANHAVGAFTGAVCLTPYSAYRTYHLRHHQFTHAEKDAEPVAVLRTRFHLVAALAFATLGLAATLWASLARSLTGRPPEAGDRLRRRGLDSLSLAASGTFLLVLACLWWSQGAMFVALLYGGPFAVYLVLSAATFLPEHYECEYGPGLAWNTSRTTTSNAVARFLLWNANFHTAHHLVAAVPGHALPELHSLIDQRCVNTERTYAGYYAGLWRRIGRKELPAGPPWTS